MSESEDPQAVEESARARAKREQIRAAAQRLFLELGYERASMDAIARAAGVSKQTLYHYYAAKEQLFVDVLRALTIERFQQEAPAVFAEQPITSRRELEVSLLAYATSAVEHILSPEYVALLRTLIAEVPRFPQIAGHFRSSLIGQGSAALNLLLTHAWQAGVITQPPSEEVLLLFVAPFLSYLLADGLISGSAEPQKPSTEVIQTHVRLFLAALT
ncbi:MAG TPA: TetR/AcrR family transcriptional regulator [Ktedonobacterales bacterium]|jgi:TetR/AcrR family transcriptional regulator, mexJK operon transcriptional repressor|nr:TetR/AcrR family transcriptional regulator [Ktedonobacterales bacterium]